MPPARKHRRRIDSIVRRNCQPLTAPKAKAISEWVTARQALGTAADLAARLGINVHTVYRYAPIKAREERHEQN